MSIESPKSVDIDNIVLIKDYFGTYCDKNYKSHEIDRFTWKNRNKIQVQIINYGARIISIKVPDRHGVIEDIVLGFDDLAGYIFYQQFYFGATIGRSYNSISSGETNLEGNHYSEGLLRLDQVVWTTHVSGTKVVMTHVSKHLSKGSPGDIFVRVTFELSDMNEFKIDMEAFTSVPTILNLSNLMYFNLAGHYKGAEEIYKQIVTINADCFLKQEDDSFTGEICNVANFPFDFQIPKMLGKYMGVSPGDGFKKFLCVNKGIDQGDCFIGRVVHNPSGRVLEIYSNQKCVCFTTANEFGKGRFLTMQQIGKTSKNNQKLLDSKTRLSTKDDYLTFVKRIHNKLEETLQEDKEHNYGELTNLIALMGTEGQQKIYNVPNNTPTLGVKPPIGAKDLILTNRQKEYLKAIHDVILDEHDNNCEKLKNTVLKLLRFSITPDEGYNRHKTTITNENKSSVVSGNSTASKYSNYNKNKDEIIGKDRTTYKMHSGIAFQTQSYPYSDKFKNVPSSILNPGDNYRHTITYKFWVRAGNPSRWIKKNKNELGRKSF